MIQTFGLVFNQKKRNYSCLTADDIKNLYPKDSKKQLAITKKLAIFVGATNTLLSMIDSPEFHDFLAEINGQYNIPGRKKLGDEIQRVYAELKHTISDVLHHANRISICCDIWSKQGMTASFLGVTVHCFTLFPIIFLLFTHLRDASLGVSSCLMQTHHSVLFHM